MKTVLWILILSSLLLGGCLPAEKQEANKPSTSEHSVDVKQIAWKSLTDSERKEIIGDWKDAVISTVIADGQRFGLKDHSFEGKEVTMVTFHSTRSALLGDINKLIDEKSKKVIGSAFRE